MKLAKKKATKEEWKSFKTLGDSLIKINGLKIAKLKLKMKNIGITIDNKFQKNIYVMEEIKSETQNGAL